MSRHNLTQPPQRPSPPPPPPRLAGGVGLSVGNPVLVTGAYPGQGVQPVAPPPPAPPPQKPPPLKHPEGHDLPFADRVRDELFCPICTLVARDAVVTEECGHLFCEACIAENRKVTAECPICRLAITTNGDNDIRKDVRARREIGNLLVYCSNNLPRALESARCEWKGPLSDLANHISQKCGLTIIFCSDPHCPVRCKRKDMPSHTCMGRRMSIGLRQKREWSATRIQAVWRGAWQRRRYLSFLRLVDCEASMQNRQIRQALFGSSLRSTFSPPRSASFHQRMGNLPNNGSLNPNVGGGPSIAVSHPLMVLMPLPPTSVIPPAPTSAYSAVGVSPESPSASSDTLTDASFQSVQDEEPAGTMAYNPLGHGNEEILEEEHPEEEEEDGEAEEADDAPLDDGESVEVNMNSTSLSMRARWDPPLSPFSNVAVIDEDETHALPGEDSHMWNRTIASTVREEMEGDDEIGEADGGERDQQPHPSQPGPSSVATASANPAIQVAAVSSGQSGGGGLATTASFRAAAGLAGPSSVPLHSILGPYAEANHEVVEDEDDLRSTQSAMDHPANFGYGEVCEDLSEVYNTTNNNNHQSHA